MINEEKAIELSNEFKCITIGERCKNIEDACYKITRWKQQQIIEKAVKWLENNYSNYEQTYADVGGYIFSDFNIDKMLIDFKKAMDK